MATVNISLTTTANTKTMSAGTAFTTSVDDTDYQFVTITDVTASNTGTAVPFDSSKNLRRYLCNNQIYGRFKRVDKIYIGRC